jgi:hypothetical protein
MYPESTSRHLLLSVTTGLVLLGLLGGCTDSKSGADDTGATDPGEPTSDLSIGAVPDGRYADFGNYFDKHVDVFGLNIFATAATPDDKVLHAAHVLAQYLDNDEDGSPDSADLIAELTNEGASMVMFATEDDLETSGIFESTLPDHFAVQDLFGFETRPEGSSSAGFDATLEEVLHLVSSRGYASVYPAIFGEDPGSALADAMDLARGGYIDGVPNSYSDAAWYHYDDETCDYPCQVTEYFYWALTSQLGAQSYGDRCEEIAVEWELCTSELLQSGDPAVFGLLTNSQYGLPTVLPDGRYGAD